MCLNCAPPKSPLVAIDAYAPSDRVAEQRLVGCALIDRKCFFHATELVTARDFYVPEFGKVWKALPLCFVMEQEVDLFDLGNVLADKETSQLWWTKLLVSSAEACEHSRYVCVYASKVAEMAVRRKEIACAVKQIESALDY